MNRMAGVWSAKAEFWVLFCCLGFTMAVEAIIMVVSAGPAVCSHHRTAPHTSPAGSGRVKHFFRFGDCIEHSTRGHRHY
jgi:hypothetical protein